jgi:hypothetical protein
VQFIGFWEYCAEDTMKVIEKFRQVTAEREKGTTRFPKLVYGPYHFNGEHKGFVVFDTDDPDQLTNQASFYAPEMEWKFVPLIDTRKRFDLWLKMKK